MRALKIAAMILTIFPGSCVAYYSYWDYQWSSANALASEFCASVPVGSDVSDAVARARKRERRVVSGTREGQDYALISFPGPAFNGAECELIAVDGRVTSKLANLQKLEK